MSIVNLALSQIVELVFQGKLSQIRWTRVGKMPISGEFQGELGYGVMRCYLPRTRWGSAAAASRYRVIEEKDHVLLCLMFHLF